MTLNDVHSILFNAYLLFTLALGAWSALMAARRESISGGFWGAVATGAILAGVILVVGGIMFAQGLRVERPSIYFLYMFWLMVIMPGLFTLLRGRDDSSAALAFSLLSFFNFFVALSMLQRGLISPWVLPLTAQ
jgi:hypothetical protein